MPGFDRPILAGLTPAEMQMFVTDRGYPAYRAAQLAAWLYRQHQPDPAAMGNLPAALRRELAEAFYAPSSRIAQRVDAADGTAKLLLALADGETIEMVLIPSSPRLTFCLSTQVGCPVRCRFCASGADGLRRNLRRGEILEEYLHGTAAAGRTPDNLVFMGIGEGMLNLDELLPALERLTAPDGFGLSPRRITVSTSGIVPGIRRLAAVKREYNLAISLHAVNDELRAQLIPDHCRYPVAEILQAADEYRETAGRMVTFEYTLLAGVNDSPADAAELGKLSRRHHAKVNLIPFNETDSRFRRPERRVIEAFAAEVERNGGHVTVRRERGGGENAACGQLRRASGGAPRS